MIGVACSSNSGKSFGVPILATGDFRRLSVGSDGFVYAVYVNGGNITLNKYSSCQPGSRCKLAFQSPWPAESA